MGRVLFREVSMNSLVLTRLRCSELSHPLDLRINYSFSLSDLAFHLGLRIRPEISLWREERPEARYVTGKVSYALFQPHGKQTLAQVRAELARVFWFPVDTRVLMHFAKHFPSSDMPYEVLALGSVHRPVSSDSDLFQLSCLSHEDAEWLVQGVQLEGGDDVSQYTILACQ